MRFLLSAVFFMCPYINSINWGMYISRRCKLNRPILRAVEVAARSCPLKIFPLPLDLSGSCEEQWQRINFIQTFIKISMKSPICTPLTLILTLWLTPWQCISEELQLESRSNSVFTSKYNVLQNILPISRTETESYRNLQKRSPLDIG